MNKVFETSVPVMFLTCAFWQHKSGTRALLRNLGYDSLSSGRAQDWA